MNGQCDKCQNVTEVRIRTDKGAWGPVDVQTCRACHEAEIASVKAEAKRFHIRLTIPKAWDKLTTSGAFRDAR
jgi:hypothetical protein